MREPLAERLRESVYARTRQNQRYDQRRPRSRLNSMVEAVLSRARGEQRLDALRRRGLTVGDRTYVGSRTVFDPGFLWAIEVGTRVVIAHDVRVIAHDASMRRTLGYTAVDKVTICDGAYVGAASILLPGVTIGERSVVGAGSLVRADVPPETVVAGNPAQVLSTRAEWLERHRQRIETRPRFEVGPAALNAPATLKEIREISEALAGGAVYVK